MLIVYGLKNCDTCRKARKWLDGKGAEYRFVDLRADGFAEDDLERWAEAVGWEALLNRRGTTWRGLDEAEKSVDGASDAVALMAKHPALMKRPVFDDGAMVVVGFTADSQKRVEGML
jgi:Spx/MgsR family transcriptional regulator